MPASCSDYVGEGAKKKILKRPDDVMIKNKSVPDKGKPNKHFKKSVSPSLTQIQTKNKNILKPEEKFKFINNTSNNVNTSFQRNLNDFPPIKNSKRSRKKPRSALKNEEPLNEKYLAMIPTPLKNCNTASQKLEQVDKKYHAMIPTPLEGTIDFSRSGVRGQQQELQQPDNFSTANKQNFFSNNGVTLQELKHQVPYNFSLVDKRTFFQMCHNFAVAAKDPGKYDDFSPISHSEVHSTGKFENYEFIRHTLKNVSAIIDGRFDVKNIPFCDSPDFSSSSTRCDTFEVLHLLKEVKKEFLFNLKMDSNLLVSPSDVEEALSNEIWNKLNIK